MIALCIWENVLIFQEMPHHIIHYYRKSSWAGERRRSLWEAEATFLLMLRCHCQPFAGCWTLLLLILLAVSTSSDIDDNEGRHSRPPLSCFRRCATNNRASSGGRLSSSDDDPQQATNSSKNFITSLFDKSKNLV